MRILLVIMIINCSCQSFSQNVALNEEAAKTFKASIDNHSLVGLGEEGHGYESLNEAKSFLLEFLHQEFNFNSVIFESSFTECVISYLNNDSLNNRLRNFLYPFWNTISVQNSLLNYYEKEKVSKQPLILACDIQEDCRFNLLSGYLIKENIIRSNKNKLNECDSILSLYIGKNFSKKTPISNDEFIRLSSNYNFISKELEDLKNIPDVKHKLLLRCLVNRELLCYYLTIRDVNERMHYRDSLMADNVMWLKNEFLKNMNIVLWAANTHVSKQNSNDRPRWLGEWLTSSLKNQYYSISFQSQKRFSSNHDRFTENCSIKYPDDSHNRFDAIIYTDKKIKIKPQQWVTPCN